MTERAPVHVRTHTTVDTVEVPVLWVGERSVTLPRVGHISITAPSRIPTADEVRPLLTNWRGEMRRLAVDTQPEEARSRIERDKRATFRPILIAGGAFLGLVNLGVASSMPEAYRQAPVTMAVVDVGFAAVLGTAAAVARRQQEIATVGNIVEERASLTSLTGDYRNLLAFTREQLPELYHQHMDAGRPTLTTSMSPIAPTPR